MSCTELGLSDYGWRVARSSDAEETGTFTPATIDLADYSGTFKVRAELDDASALLTVTTTATANGSVMVFSENTVLLRLKAADLDTLPVDATDASDPWTGWFEWLITDPDGLTTRFLQLPFIVERGAAE